MYEPGQSSVAFDPSQAGLALSYHDSDAVAECRIMSDKVPTKTMLLPNWSRGNLK